MVDNYRPDQRCSSLVDSRRKSRNPAAASQLAVLTIMGNKKKPRHPGAVH
jgi:hypothetical protein